MTNLAIHNDFGHFQNFTNMFREFDQKLIILDQSNSSPPTFLIQLGFELTLKTRIERET